MTTPDGGGFGRSATGTGAPDGTGSGGTGSGGTGPGGTGPGGTGSGGTGSGATSGPETNRPAGTGPATPASGPGLGGLGTPAPGSTGPAGGSATGLGTTTGSGYGAGTGTPGGTGGGFSTTGTAGSLGGPATRPAAPAGAAAVVTSASGGMPVSRGKPRRARLVLRRVDPWSVLKFSLVFSLCLLIVFVVAVTALYLALDALGVFDSLNEFVRTLTEADSGGQTTGGVEVAVSGGRVIGGSLVIGLVNVVIITAISTLGAFLYNLCADIVGGIEVTLAERE